MKMNSTPIYTETKGSYFIRKVRPMCIMIILPLIGFIILIVKIDYCSLTSSEQTIYLICLITIIIGIALLFKYVYLHLYISKFYIFQDSFIIPAIPNSFIKNPSIPVIYFKDITKVVPMANVYKHLVGISICTTLNDQIICTDIHITQVGREILARIILELKNHGKIDDQQYQQIIMNSVWVKEMVK
jgi:hypothetical protein